MFDQDQYPARHRDKTLYAWLRSLRMDLDVEAADASHAPRHSADFARVTA